MTELLVPAEQYKKAGVIIGTQICTKFMRRFTYKVLPEGFYLLDIAKVDERLRIAARFLARFEPSKIVVVSTRIYAQKPAEMMCKYVGCKAITGRIVPGTFTNPKLSYYVEPEVVLVSDPRTDKQALIEASKARIPVVAFLDTDNKIEMVDLVIPANNRGRKSLALLYWILTREILRNRGVLGVHQNLDVSYEDFMAAKIEATA
ncbi:MAG: 30S ribosomal protein S2 [Acidilobaceae archaeon]